MDMSFTLRPENRDLLDRVAAMIRDEIMPLEDEYAAEVAEQIDQLMEVGIDCCKAIAQRAAGFRLNDAKIHQHHFIRLTGFKFHNPKPQ